MAGVTLDVILPFIVVCLVIGAAFAAQVVQSLRARANLTALADRLGLSLESEGRFLKKHRLSGEFRGRPLRIFSYTTGSGKSRRTWAALAVGAHPRGELAFTLKRRPALVDGLLRLFRKNEAATGDGSFDRRWILVTRQPELMATVLIPELRERVNACCTGTSCSLKLSGHELLHAEQGSFGTKRVCGRLEALAALAADLATAAETASELQSGEA